MLLSLITINLTRLTLTLIRTLMLNLRSSVSAVDLQLCDILCQHYKHILSDYKTFTSTYNIPVSSFFKLT